MTRAIDPFEEFLRKKKVEMLQQKYRPEPDEDEDVEETPPEDLVVEDPETEERIQEEMEEFIETGSTAGAEYFSKLENNLSEEKVEEIKDALEEVFEEDIVDEPETVPADEKFVEFFQQVQSEFEGPSPPATAEVAAEVVQPDSAEVASPALELEPAPPAPDDESRLNLDEILTEPIDGEKALQQRVDLLCRLLAKVLDRLDVPENEIIEVLIKSGVEF